MDDFKSFRNAILLSLVVIFAFDYFFVDHKKTPTPAAQTAAVEELSVKETANLSTEEKSPVEQTLTTDEVLQSSPRLEIDNDSLKGSLRISGGRIDNLWLKKYKQNIDAGSPEVELFTPAKTTNPYYAEFGWLSSDKQIKLPDSETLWTVKGSRLTPTTPVVLEWDNGQGLRFITKISIDDHYMFTINQSVENNSSKNITLYPYGFIARSNNGSFRSGIVHEGMIGVFNDKLEEIKYSDLKKEPKKFKTSKGWLGFSDRYWFSAFILDAPQPAKVKFSQNGTLYQADFVGSPLTVDAGGIGSTQQMLYAGAKEIKLLDKYTKDLHINKFDLAVDFGWYYFLTKPFFYILDYLYKIIGNMGWAILLFAALLRLIMFPIANKSFENMAKMKKLQPKLRELQEKYADDKRKIQQETLLLYQKEKINPASGCLPMFIQIPVFFSLYKVLNIAIEIRQAPFIGWIKDLSAPDPLTISSWSHLPIPGVLDIGVWPIIMGITMFIQQKMNPAPTNKDQARAFALMPLIFTFMMGHFAAGLVIYWSFSNLLAILQQRAILYKNRN